MGGLYCLSGGRYIHKCIFHFIQMICDFWQANLCIWNGNSLIAQIITAFETFQKISNYSTLVNTTRIYNKIWVFFSTSHI